MRADLAGRLRRCALFGQLTGEDLRQIAALGRERRVRKGDFFFRKGDHPARVYVLIHGQVVLLLSTRGGGQIAYKMIAPSEHFGDIAVFSGTPHIFSAQAREDCQAIAWDAKAIARAITNHPDIVRNSASSAMKEWKKLQRLRSSLGKGRQRLQARRVHQQHH